jgi:hypothetical protein
VRVDIARSLFHRENIKSKWFNVKAFTLEIEKALNQVWNDIKGSTQRYGTIYQRNNS